MDGFIKLSNFPRILPYAELFKQGIIVTILLSLLTVVIGFLLCNVFFKRYVWLCKLEENGKKTGRKIKCSVLLRASTS